MPRARTRYVKAGGQPRGRQPRGGQGQGRSVNEHRTGWMKGGRLERVKSSAK